MRAFPTYSGNIYETSYISDSPNKSQTRNSNMLPYLTSWAADACYFTSASDGYSMFALIPCSGDYSGAALVVRSVALLHVRNGDGYFSANNSFSICSINS